MLSGFPSLSKVPCHPFATGKCSLKYIEEPFERKLLDLSWSAIWKRASKVKYALHLEPDLELLKCLVKEDRYSFLFGELAVSVGSI